MSEVKQMVKLSQYKYELLKQNGTLETNDGTLVYDPTLNIYVTPVNSSVYMRQINIDSTGNVSQEIEPNILYNFTDTAITSLTISWGDSIVDKVNEYIFQFVACAGFTGLTMPEGVVWMGGTELTFTEGKTYQVSVLNNLAVIGEF